MGQYDDIINMPHHVSEKRQCMSQRDRAAQFSPFAALTGYDDKIDETARFVDTKAELSEDMRSLLDRQTYLLSERISQLPVVKVTHFVPDMLKNGGEYREYTGTLRRLDPVSGEFVFTDGFRIKLSDVYSLESDIFKDYDEWRN